MKKMIIVLMLFISINALSQTYELYECTKTGVSKTELNQWETKDVSFIVRINIDKGIIEFENNAQTIIHINTLIDTRKIIDGEGDEYIYNAYTAYDDEGLRCEFRSFDYTSLLNRNFLIRYEDYMFFFACKMISNTKKNEENKQIL